MGVNDYKTGIQIFKSNISKGMDYLMIGINGDYPIAYHTLAELIHFETVKLPQTYIELYNLSTTTRKCEVSVNFYAKSILRGYLKNWLSMAEKRYLLRDYDSSYLLYAYSSFLGLPQGSYSAGYSWHKMRTSTFECSLSSSEACALFYYLHGVDYFKSMPRISDLLLYSTLEFDLPKRVL